jgi:hypothetical protein
MLAAGVGDFLAQTQKSRTFSLEMEPHTEDTKPMLEFSSEENFFSDLDTVYPTSGSQARAASGRHPSFRRQRARLLAIADSCGPEWGQRAREAILFLLEKQQAERPQITIVRHGLAIFDALGVDQIGSVLNSNDSASLTRSGHDTVAHLAPTTPIHLRCTSKAPADAAAKMGNIQ